MIIKPEDYPVNEFHSFLLGAVGPRPIAFASTIDKNGNVNLSPFSFFNVFSSNPPVLIFSPARRVRDNTTKHTLENVKEVPEVVINIVNYSMVQQTSLASTEYDKGVNEFIKAGFTEAPSTSIKPPRVKEAPVSFECDVIQVIELGQSGGAGNLILCKIKLAHAKEEIFDTGLKIDPNKIDLVARMGADYYCRASGKALFEVPKPLQTKGIGIDRLPEKIKSSTVLTGNDLGMLANIEQLPEKDTIQDSSVLSSIKDILSITDQNKRELLLHMEAKSLLAQNKVTEAWKILLLSL
ncbi:MAG TPA: flavin reductase family protein [Cytophagaceae bacterium]